MHTLAIIGAGPVGLVAALSLAHQAIPLEVILLDAQAQDSVSIDRNLALSHGSMLLLSRLGVWQTLSPKPHPIAQVVVNQAGGLGNAVLSAKEQQVPALGYTLSYAALQKALRDALTKTKVSSVYEARAVSIDEQVHLADGRSIAADVVVVADGGGELLSETKVVVNDPKQTAILCQVEAQRPTLDRALERFTQAGPLALLPTSSHRYAVVWTHEAHLAQARQEHDPLLFCKALEVAANFATGTLTLRSPVKTHPLLLRYLTPRAQGKMVAIGNAAQSLHPIAGQGLNLGMRDAWALTDFFIDHPNAKDFSAYAKARERDRQSGIIATQSLLTIFGLPAWANLPRGLGIAAFDLILPLKKSLTERFMLGF